jgi:hypothetical protein
VALRRPGVRVVGLKQFQKELRALGDDAVDDLKKAHAAAAKIVEDAARPNVPVSSGTTSVVSGTRYWAPGPSNSGAFRATLRSSGQRRGGYVRAGKKLVPYAGPVHFGWPNRPDPAKGWRGGPIRPNPFLYDALDKRREQVAQAFAGYIDDIRRKHRI